MLWKAEISLKGNLACIQTFFLQCLDTGPLWIPAFNLNRPPCLNKALLYHSYLFAYWKLVNAMSSSRLGSGKWVWIGRSQQMKAKAPKFPILRTPNTNSLTACRLCEDFFFWCPEPSCALLPYCCLYYSHAVCKTHTFRQTASNPGW